MPHFFCDRINFLKCRAHLGLSQAELGGRIGVTAQVVWSYERGKRAIPEARARKVQDLLLRHNSDGAQLQKAMTAQHIAELDAMYTPVHEGDRRPHEHGQLHTPDFSIEDVFSDSVEKTS